MFTALSIACISTLLTISKDGITIFLKDLHKRIKNADLRFLFISTIVLYALLLGASFAYFMVSSLPGLVHCSGLNREKSQVKLF
jgi:Sec-independent protein secretion pathway component TatC